MPQNSSRTKCEEGKKQVSRLNAEDKKWMQDIMKCVMDKMTKTYKGSEFNCYMTVEVVLNRQADCYVENDFCKVGWSRRDALKSVFEEHMKKPGKYLFPLLWKNLQRAAAKCLTKDSEKLVTWMKKQFPTL
ncbi:uncharacterized protein LOC128250809 isoform X2 [Octopus bimaculoides]|uniref:uncharacterized protein LOC128250809 isoform X2 n=1 Tax=Octopus bimaculoides TaxID=37653 RepID=UPI0022E4EB8E|nr:uncharacterized protein LOC128250809 isoform X2 [Octopus bimaculoides]